MLLKAGIFDCTVMKNNTKKYLHADIQIFRCQKQSIMGPGIREGLLVAESIRHH